MSLTTQEKNESLNRIHRQLTWDRSLTPCAIVYQVCKEFGICTRCQSKWALETNMCTRCARLNSQKSSESQARARLRQREKLLPVRQLAGG